MRDSLRLNGKQTHKGLEALGLSASQGPSPGLEKQKKLHGGGAGSATPWSSLWGSGRLLSALGASFSIPVSHPPQASFYMRSQ